MGDIYAARIERIRGSLAEASIEALWVEPSANLVYLTGLKPISMERVMGLVIRPTGDLRLVVPSLLADESAHVPDCDAFEWTDSDGPEAALAEALGDVKVLHVSPGLPVGIAETIRRDGAVTIELEDAILASARARKDVAEAEALRRAGSVTDGVVEWIGTQDLDGVTEIEFALRLRIRYLEMGHVPWEEMLVASGANAAMPHYAGGEVPLGFGAPILFDIGGAVGGYQSDTTRVFFPEETDPEIADAYSVLLAAYEAAFAAVEAGTPCEEVDRAARRVITEAGYGASFIHRTGHGVGLEIHEHPYIREGNGAPLEVGNAFSIEPGIYVEGRFGLRYENLVYLGPEGPEALNNTPAHHLLTP